MWVIEETIQPRSWISVRDRIGQIIKDNLFYQYSVNYIDWLDCDVFVERWAPITTEETTLRPVICVSVESITPTNETLIDSDQLVTFNIMTHTSEPATPGKGSDENSSFSNQDISSVIHGIFSHPKLIKLGFPAPFIMRRRVSDIKFGKVDRKESYGLIVSIITLEVLFSQNEPVETGVPIAGYVTSMKMKDTNRGYKFEI